MDEERQTFGRTGGGSETRAEKGRRSEGGAVRPTPNLGQLKALDAYYAWRREQAKK